MPKSGKEYVRAAEKGGMAVRNGKGDHVVVTAKDGYTMTIPLHKELKTGTAHAIAKWLLKYGIIAGFAYLVYLANFG